MIPNLLYKYLDADGGFKMLKNHNLQFTNATILNDPFDCHYELINFSNVPKEKCKIWPAEIISDLESCQYRNLHKDTWVCSLSKVYDKLLMWCFYSGYDGICIGIDREKTKQDLSNILNGVYIGAQEMEVQYKDIIDKPDYFRNYGPKDLFHYQLSTKAKDWEYEQEVRLLLMETSYMGAHFRPHISQECFCELYLGVKMDKEKQDEIVDAARSINPEIKIFNMTIDPGEFRLKAIPFCDNH